MKMTLRQGDVVIICDAKIPAGAVKLSHCILAKGEDTGHMHQITEGEATLYEDG